MKYFIIVALIVAGIVFAVPYIKEANERGTAAVADKDETGLVEKSVDAVKETAGKVADKTGEALESAGEATDKALDKAGEIASDTADAVKGAAKKTAEVVGETTEDVIEGTKEVAEKTVEGAKELASDAAEGTKNAVAAVSGAAEDLVDGTEEAATKVSESAENAEELAVDTAAGGQEIAAAAGAGKITNPGLLTTAQDFDIVYGEADAPVTIVEYASLSCSHCRDFYTKIFSEIKKDYIDNGKVRLVYRHFPLNMPALRAAQIVECVDTEERKKLFLGALFKSQDEWAYAPSEEEFLKNLEVVSKIGGLKPEDFKRCTTDAGMEKKILENQLNAGKGLGVSSTPAIFIAGEKLEDKNNLEAVKKAIDSALN